MGHERLSQLLQMEAKLRSELDVVRGEIHKESKSPRNFNKSKMTPLQVWEEKQTLIDVRKFLEEAKKQELEEFSVIPSSSGPVVIYKRGGRV